VDEDALHPVTRGARDRCLGVFHRAGIVGAGGALGERPLASEGRGQGAVRRRVEVVAMLPSAGRRAQRVEWGVAAPPSVATERARRPRPLPAAV